jgi:hypothetical protein
MPRAKHHPWPPRHRDGIIAFAVGDIDRRVHLHSDREQDLAVRLVVVGLQREKKKEKEKRATIPL